MIEHRNGSYIVGCLLAMLAVLGSGVSRCQVPEKRSITADDSVRTQMIVPEEVKISNDGREVAYVVKSPDLPRNRNIFTLYVRSVRDFDRRENGRKLIEADNISGIRWIDQGKLAARVEQREGARNRDRLIIVQPSTGAHETIECPKGAQDFSMTPDEQVIVFSTVAAVKLQNAAQESSIGSKQRLRGYVIPFRRDYETFVSPTNAEIEVYRRNARNRFEISKLYFTGPEGPAKRSTLADVEALNLSPDGKYLLFRYWENNLPAGWEEQPVIKQFRASHSPGALYVLGLCELNSGRTRYAFNFSAGFISKTVWAADSRSYAVVSPSPFGSSEGDDEERAAAASGNEYFYMYQFAHVFTVDVKTGQVTRVLSRHSGTPGDYEFRNDGPLAWKKSQGEFLLRAGTNEFARMIFQDGAWEEAGQFEFAEPGSFGSSFASDNRTLVGVSQSPDVPPDILGVDLESKRRALLTNLNPGYEHIALGEISDIDWKNRYGSRCEGKLIKPVGYEPGKRYPFVLMGTHSKDAFVGATAYFAPQSLANAGFVVLLAGYPLDRKIPQGQYPGAMSEAFNWMAMVESAIDLLSNQGLIDTDRVGIVGFSRSSFLTDFTLSHSPYHFAAASSADGEAYGYAEYTRFLDMADLLSYEAEIGGPPYGPTLENWLDYAAPFNSSHIHAPLLMESTRMEAAYELFTLLNRQGKPVELYFYPNGQHPLDTPLERVSSLERNIDWFRFWLQGYERPNPEDPEQYSRWRALRASEEAEK